MEQAASSESKFRRTSLTLTSSLTAFCSDMLLSAVRICEKVLLFRKQESENTRLGAYDGQHVRKKLNTFNNEEMVKGIQTSSYPYGAIVYCEFLKIDLVFCKNYMFNLPRATNHT
ncbi:hypothetical protein GQX74_003675 [Glossina fuscipes]|nr:hypothetical protein GQX74_003675 [Glossina fuscipes]